MISLHVTLYTLDEDEGDRFKVLAAVDGSDDLVDVTDQYEVVAIATDDKRGGFAVLKLPAAVAGGIGGA